MVFVMIFRFYFVLMNVIRLQGHFLYKYSRICQSKTAVFDCSPNRAFLHSRKRAFSTQLFSTEFSDWGIQSKNSTFSTGSVSRKTQSKKFYTCFFNPSHRSSHHKTHTHTPTHPYQVPHSSIIQQRRRFLGYHCCCFSPQVSVAHT